MTERPAGPSSSFWKLSAMLLGVIGAALLLMWLLTSWALNSSFDEVGKAIILDDLGEYQVLYNRGGIEGVRALFTAGEHAHDQMMRIVDSRGVVRLDVLPPGLPGLGWPTMTNQRAPQPGEILWHRNTLPDGTTLTIGRRGMADGAELWFGRSNASDLAAIRRVHELILLAMTLTALLAIGPVIWFAGRVLRPVRSLIAGAHRLAEVESLDHRLETSQAIPELREFSDAFNASLDRIQGLTEELEAANDQLAHELRTPLARIRGNVEQVLHHTAEDSPAREPAIRAIREIERAAALIQQILSIRAGDSRTMKLQLETISLSDLVRESCELYSAASGEKDLILGFQVTGKETPLAVDSQRLQQALCNLLDNALAYTPSGGRVAVELAFEPDNAMLRVRDTGPGLTEADLPRIWGRFTRGSAASANTPGIGLGLSLVRAVAHAHHGEAGARNLPEGGAEFWIRLPIQS